MAGKHLEMVAHLSEDAQHLLDALLQVDGAKRPTMRDILHFPAVRTHVNSLLHSADFEAQFNTLIAQKLNFEKESDTEVSALFSQKARPSDNALISDLKNDYFKRIGHVGNLLGKIYDMKREDKFFEEEVVLHVITQIC